MRIADQWETKYYAERLSTTEKLRRGLRDPQAALQYVSNRLSIVIRQVNSSDYYETYLDLSDGGAASVDPDHDIPDEQGRWQFNWLKDRGLTPDDELFELGCGFGRLGVLAIPYLKSGNYTGIDISKPAVTRFREIVSNRKLTEKAPTIHQNEDLTFSGEPYTSVSADYAYAYSVFTHLPPDKIEECLAHLDRVLASNGSFYATFHQNNDIDFVLQRPRGIGFEYPLHFFRELADCYGLSVRTVEAHGPRDHEMLEIELS